MNRTSKSYSVTLPNVLADAIEHAAKNDFTTPGLTIAAIVEDYVTKNFKNNFNKKELDDLKLLRDLRDEAIDIMNSIGNAENFPADISYKTFQACQTDENWLKRYEKYIRGDAFSPGNPRKTNANQTIGSRIKSVLGAEDLLDAAGKVQRGRAPVGNIIQTYQLLRRP